MRGSVSAALTSTDQHRPLCLTQAIGNRHTARIVSVSPQVCLDPGLGLTETCADAREGRTSPGAHTRWRIAQAKGTLSRNCAARWLFAYFRSVPVIGRIAEGGRFRENLQPSHIPMPESQRTPDCDPLRNAASLSRGCGPGTPAGDPGGRRWCSLLQIGLLTSQCRTLPRECGVIDL